MGDMLLPLGNASYRAVTVPRPHPAPRMRRWQQLEERIEQVRGLRPVLATGTQRGGTTFTGTMLNAGGETTYHHEPLFPSGPRVISSDVKHWYQYVCVDNEQDFLEGFVDFLQCRYYTWADVDAFRSGATSCGLPKTSPFRFAIGCAVRGHC